MKKLFLSCLLVLSAIAASAQILPYRPYAEYNGDMGTYLKYNFEERSDLYKGKTIGDLLKDVELTPIGYSLTSWYSQDDYKFYVFKIDIVFKRKTEGQFSEISDEYLSIYLETPFAYEEIRPLYKKTFGKTWTTEDYEFLKDKTIKVIKYQYC